MCPYSALLKAKSFEADFGSVFEFLFSYHKLTSVFSFFSLADWDFQIFSIMFSTYCES